MTGGEITVGGGSKYFRIYKITKLLNRFCRLAVLSPDGRAEFQNATIRGTLNASDITAGTLNVNALTSDGSIDGDKITANSITTSELNFTPATSSDLSNYVTISSTTAGTLDIIADDVEIQGNLSATGTITADAGFVSGVAIVPTSTTSAVNMNGSSSLTSNLIASSGGTFKTGSSGARVELGQDGTDSFVEFYEYFRQCAVTSRS